MREGQVHVLEEGEEDNGRGKSSSLLSARSSLRFCLRSDSSFVSLSLSLSLSVVSLMSLSRLARAPDAAWPYRD